MITIKYPLAASVAHTNEVVDLCGDALHANPRDNHLPLDQKVEGHGIFRKEIKKVEPSRHSQG